MSGIVYPSAGFCRECQFSSNHEILIAGVGGINGRLRVRRAILRFYRGSTTSITRWCSRGHSYWFVIMQDITGLDFSSEKKHLSRSSG